MSKSFHSDAAPVSWLGKLHLGNLLPVAALLTFGSLFFNHIQALDGREIWHSLSAFTLGQWTLAAAFTALSFRAVGTYDVLVHRVLGTGVRETDARRSGVLAIALSQTLGFGAITGAFVRWRRLPNLGAGTVARLSAVVSVSFLVALAVIGGLVIPISGLVPSSEIMDIQPYWFLLGGLAVACLLILSRLAFQKQWIPRPLTGPLLASLLGATFFDTAFAAAAFWVLWPDPASFHLVFAAYLIALGAGLVSNCPGGIGAFDLTLLGLLQATDANAATASILAFRLAYYIVPATIAVLCLTRPPTTETMERVDHPEGTLTLQSAKLTKIANNPTLILPCWGQGAIFGDLTTPTSLTNLPHYKCSGKQALAARAAGWAVLRCAEDALIDLNQWSLEGANKRQLRRALKSFSASGLTIRAAHHADNLRPAADAWTRLHGREKGHSMGRFDPAYLRQQRVFVALKGTEVVAFVSFHISRDQWTLDLMRHGASLPKGTMQALVTTAIDAARDVGITTLSLASVPNPPLHLPFAQHAHRKSAGLRRFKRAFAPRWSPRYICARSPISLGLTMVTLAWAIHRPPPLANLAQSNDEDYSFAPIGPTCEGLPSQ